MGVYDSNKQSRNFKFWKNSEEGCTFLPDENTERPFKLDERHK